MENSIDTIWNTEEGESLEKKTPAQPASVATGQTGVIDRSMSKLPYLNLTQRVGEMGEEFGYGKLVYNQAVELTEEMDPEITVLENRVGWQENLKFGESEDLPRNWASKEAAMAAGVTQFEYGPDNSPPEAVPYCQATGIISVKADLGGFRKGPDGRFYAAAIWFLSKAAFGSAGRKMVSQFAQLGAGADISLFPWAISAKEKTFKQNRYYVPIVKPRPHHDVEVHKFISTFLNS